MYEPLIELVISCNQHGEGLLRLAACTPGLLPHRGNRSGEAVENARVEATNVDAKFKRSGRDNAAERSIEEFFFNLPTFRREIAASVRTHSGRKTLCESPLNIGCNEFRSFTAATERNRAVIVFDESAHELRGVSR